MIKNNAVLATVLFALTVSLGSVSYTFYQLYWTNRAKHIDNIFAKHALIAQIYHTYLLKQISEPMLEANLALYELDEVVSDKEYKPILEQGNTLKTDGDIKGDGIEYDSLEFLIEEPSVQPIQTHMIEFQNEIYFWLKSSHHTILLHDRTLEMYHPINLLTAYATIMVILLSSFSLIIYRLWPLRRLRRQIALFGEGDMVVSFKIHGSDEISLIANELNTTQQKIRSLIESRTLFLRNIMHELKTPIAKGRIASTMLENEKHRLRFEGIFERLESLIGEFALIEEISSGNQQIDKKEYRLIDLIDGAIDSAMVDYHSVRIVVDERVKMKVDYRLFVTALKNLIDNGIKYSSDKVLDIWMEGEEIIFGNIGNPLKQTLSYYIEPFTKDHPTKDSFGLGLYIVDAILKEHNYILAYERRDDVNCFICVPVKTKRK